MTSRLLKVPLIEFVPQDRLNIWSGNHLEHTESVKWLGLEVLVNKHLITAETPLSGSPGGDL